MERYILDASGTPVPEPDTAKWLKWFENNPEHIACDSRGTVIVSTIFLGIDANYGNAGPPILWETMVFGGKYDQFQVRYASRSDALAGHDRFMALAFEGLTDRRRVPDIPDPEAL